MNEHKELVIRKFLHALTSNPEVDRAVRMEARKALRDWDDGDKAETSGQAETTGEAKS
jgi:hypothetical protein